METTVQIDAILQHIFSLSKKVAHDMIKKNYLSVIFFANFSKIEHLKKKMVSMETKYNNYGFLLQRQSFDIPI